MKATWMLALGAVLTVSTPSIADDQSAAKTVGLGKCSQADLVGTWIGTVEESFFCTVKVTKSGQIIPTENFENCQLNMTFGGPGYTGALNLFAMKVTKKCQVHGTYVSTASSPGFEVNNNCIFLAAVSADRTRIDGFRQCDRSVNGEITKYRRAISFSKLP